MKIFIYSALIISSVFSYHLLNSALNWQLSLASVLDFSVKWTLNADFNGNELDFWELCVSGEEYSKISKKKRQIKNMCMMAKMLYIFCKAISTFCKCTTGQDVTCGQVWCPILGICALHLTHPSAHTQQWEVNKHTHTRCSGQSMLRRPGSSWGFSALLKGLTSVVVLRVERELYIHSPPPTIPAGPRLEPATFRLQVRLSNH